MGEHNMANDTHEYMTTRDVAAFLGLSPRTLDRYRVSGTGPGFHKFGNRVRYLRADVVAWAAERRCRSTSDAGAAKDTGLSGAASL
ncbi:MAG: helix-turn-helix domain-containing protein [Alphaproteobacteria bacterium]|nr:helix-turn-helix domain-containing protein [Alphaproteobacteria bacterium]